MIPTWASELIAGRSMPFLRLLMIRVTPRLLKWSDVAALDGLR